MSILVFHGARATRGTPSPEPIDSVPLPQLDHGAGYSRDFWQAVSCSVNEDEKGVVPEQQNRGSRRLGNGFPKEAVIHQNHHVYR
jgi:hypothetical protein